MWASVSVWVMGFMLLVNGVLLGAYAVLNSSTSSVYPADQQFPAIAGIGVDGSTRQGRDSRCYVIRITADNCPYCKLDYPAYTRFARAADQAGCDLVAVAPRAGQMSATAGEEDRQLTFVAMDLGEALYPFLTPQTIVLDAARKVRWHRQGTFDEPALQDGIAVLQRLGR
jgi:thiol-disulfide isomerase/thioredoxin